MRVSHRAGKGLLVSTTIQLLLCSILLVLSPYYYVSASISIVDSGKTFESKPDYRVGQRLWKGYEYIGRMQYLPDNLSLCPEDFDPHRKFTIVKPQDGLPVALVASSVGDCSLTAKAMVATTMIEPPGLVQYLVIRDQRKRLGGLTSNKSDNKKNEDGSTNLEQEEEDDMAEGFDYYEDIFDEENEVDTQEYHHTSSLLFNNNHSFVTDDESYQAAQLELEFFNKGHHRALQTFAVEDQPPVAILHVSNKVGSILMNVINTETRKVKLQGGTKILLNGAGPNGPRTLLMWMLSILLLCACGFCCMIMGVQTGLEPEEPPAPTRPARRRLTLQQVRARFPAFHFNPEQDHQNDSGGGEGAAAAAPVADQYCQLLDECTICLDEFHPGVRCRQLPCQHVFHSTCIARWLIERSATCPLCKLDLYEEEEEEAEEEEGEENDDVEMSESQPLFSRIFQSTARQRPPQELTRTTAAAGAAPPANTTTDPSDTRSWWPFQVEIAPSTDEDGHSVAPTPSRWSRWNLFGGGRRRVRVGDALTTELTEPLIAESSTTQPQTQILRQQHSLEEVTFSPSNATSVEQPEVEAAPDAETPSQTPTSAEV